MSPGTKWNAECRPGRRTNVASYSKRLLPGGRKRSFGWAIGSRFSRRLQLAPGLMPPTSWSLSPCIGPEIYWRAESFRSPAVGAIYLMPPASARNFAVMKVRVMCGIEVVRSWVKKRGSRVEWYAVPPAINSGSELLIFVRRAAHSHDPRVGSAQPGPDTRDWPCQTGLSVLQP